MSDMDRKFQKALEWGCYIGAGAVAGATCSLSAQAIAAFEKSQALDNKIHKIWGADIPSEGNTDYEKYLEFYNQSEDLQAEALTAGASAITAFISIFIIWGLMKIAHYFEQKGMNTQWRQLKEETALSA